MNLSVTVSLNTIKRQKSALIILVLLSLFFKFKNSVALISFSRLGIGWHKTLTIVITRYLRDNYEILF